LRVRQMNRQSAGLVLLLAALSHTHFFAVYAASG